MRRKVKKLLLIIGCIVCTATGTMASYLSLHNNNQFYVIINKFDFEN